MKVIETSQLLHLFSGKFSYCRMAFQRYMRLTPAIAAVIIFNDNLADFLTPDDNSKFLDYSAKPCRQLWWAALLHTQVYSNTRKMVSSKETA
jgi:hypothetical protein